MKANVTFLEIAQYSEAEAREFLERLRWPNGPVCPRVGCGAVGEATLMKGNSHRAGLYNCNACGKPFTVTVGTIFEDSHIPLKRWLLAFHLMNSSRKGVSARQLQRDLKLGSYRSAWFMCHRIRKAMESHGLLPKLSGIVEADETFIGGKPRPHGTPKPKADRKTPVAVAVERGGEARAKVLTHANSWQIKRHLQANVDMGAHLMTDEAGAYTRIGKEFAAHDTTNHSHGEYLRGIVHSNTAESFFGLLKRGHYGVFHNMSRKHLPRYVAEFTHRWNTRFLKDHEARDAALKGAEGRRLTYRQTVASA